MFFRRVGSTTTVAPKVRMTSAEKAHNFHSTGEVRNAVSHFVRAETVLMPSTIGNNDGRNFEQLSSIHPRSAFVTKTTLPRRLATDSTWHADTATSDKTLRWLSSTTQHPSRRKPCCWIHVDGNNVSSQSKKNNVSSRSGGASATDWAEPITESASASTTSTGASPSARGGSTSAWKRPGSKARSGALDCPATLAREEADGTSPSDCGNASRETRFPTSSLDGASSCTTALGPARTDANSSASTPSSKNHSSSYKWQTRSEPSTMQTDPEAQLQAICVSTPPVARTS
mmetsp:Transcript_132667/g.383591  ORF Transcript_132667/g.383591 Transcript_132667/m.383591 type:complete len:287 (+) Transcript_132667:390-1250(+)